MFRTLMEVRAHDVHFVDVDLSWYVVMVAGAKQSRMGLNAALGTITVQIRQEL
jgi:hypothetical protein